MRRSDCEMNKVNRADEVLAANGFADATAPSDAGENGKDMYKVAMNMVSTAVQLPVVRVNREEFLAKLFGKSPYLDEILKEGPQAVFTPDSLRKKADEIINDNTTKSTFASFMSGLPSNPALMAAAGGADVVQYFGFAIRLAQQLAYLFGEDDLFTDGTTELSEEAQARVLAYLGAMLGVSGAAQLISRASVTAGTTLGKRVATQALTKTAWYPLFKKVASAIGIKITKNTVGKTVTKAVPVIGGVVSGVLTFTTFKTMGASLADVLANNLKLGISTDDGMELNPDFLARG